VTGWLRRAVPRERARFTRLVARVRAHADLDALALDDLLFLRAVALEAAFADPRYGGNKAGWGWRLVGAAGDPQPTGFTLEEHERALPVAPAVRPLARWRAGIPVRATRRDDADVIVVGLGAAGGIVASVLAEAGLRVIAVEAGPAAVVGSTDEVEFNVGRRLYWNEPETLVVDDGPSVRGSWLARNIGVGGPLHWTTITYRFHPSDFRVRSTSGHVEGTSVADWPISYAELEADYARAERDVGVAGTAGANPHEGARSGPFPFPAVPLSRAARVFADAARRCGYAPYPTPAAVVTERVAGRDACVLCGRCSHYECLQRAKGNTRDTVLARAIATGRIDVRAGARAERVMVGRDGLAAGVRYRSRAGRREVFGKTVVLATGAAYQARLLLLSTSRAHPKGLANSSGLVGRNLMFHTNVSAWGVLDEPVYADRGPQTAAAFDDLDEDRPRERYGAPFVRGAAVVGGQPIAWAGGPLAFARTVGATMPAPPGVPIWGAAYRDFVARAYPRHFGVFALCEDLPVESNRVELDTTIKLADGRPGLRIHYRYHPNTLAMEEWMRERVTAVMRETGARQVTSARPAVPAGMFAGHHMGTVRMGTDPATSVVDADARAHDVPNLFLPGSGQFVTSAGVNPTGTIFALAYRTARAVARDHGIIAA
jgi:choline dehydrogenase-like flavoprotein